MISHNIPKLNKSQIKYIKSLHHKKFRWENQQFLIEGQKLVNETLRDKPEIINYIIICEDYELSSIPKGIKIYETDHSVLKNIGELKTNNTVIAVCDFFELNNTALNFQNDFSFYLDNINDPGNFGTIVRTADWFGIKTIFCSPHSVEKYNHKLIQAAKGSLLRVDIKQIELENFIRQYPDTAIYGATMGGQSIFQCDIKSGLFVLGNEANGIDIKNQKFIKNNISIPRSANRGAESLNVAMSASIIAAELFRKKN